MKRFGLALLVAGAMMFMTSDVEASGGWGSSIAGYGSTGSLRVARIGHGSTGTLLGVQRYRAARVGWGSTGSTFGRANVGGGSTGMYRARLGTGRLADWWQNRKIAPIRNLRERRAQRLATLVQHGQELNAVQEMGSADFLLVPEANTKQIIAEPPAQILEPEVSANTYETPAFTLIGPTPVKVEVAIGDPLSFALVTTTPEVVAITTSSSLSEKMRTMRRNRRDSGNAKGLLVVTR